ncbi:hypothetical protein A7J57_01310 [Agrobacterium tumefaciens]|uniref:ABC transporter permease n=1 Tax=Agrobacterium tumefaciens TaxID=358 RepID=A0A176X5V9_AGRTU|nr:hypothetical protein A7J57_01310 [Agrobacterium tumefaciens]
MNRLRLTWAAFKNMLRAAARDPLWAVLALIAMPFRIWRQRPIFAEKLAYFSDPEFKEMFDPV